MNLSKIWYDIKCLFGKHQWLYYTPADIRYMDGRRCQWCGKHSVISDKCPHCNKTEHLMPFIYENGGYFLPKTIKKDYDIFGKKINKEEK